MSQFITVSPIEDEKQNGLPAKMMINASHIYDVRPIVGTVAAPPPPAPATKPGHRKIDDPAVDEHLAQVQGDVGAIVTYHGHALRVAETPAELAKALG